MLYPGESETREVKDLSGIWKFKIDKNNEGYAKKWYTKPLTDTLIMPVPASYNDLTQDITIRDHIGDAWYEKFFFVPSSWQDKRVVLRVGSAAHFATVWVNGKQVAEHKGGYLPFEADVAALVNFGKENRVTLAVNNVLDWNTLPPGELKEINDEMHPSGYKVQEAHFDFFNYSGIHRPVKLYTTPKMYIDDITVRTDIHGKAGMVSYSIAIVGNPRKVLIRLLDEKKGIVAQNNNVRGKLIVSKAHFWEPANPYLYTLVIELQDDKEKVLDCYRLPVGIRTVKITDGQFLINGKPFYFKGFGKHEDSDLRGKGLDNVINIKDFNLLKWIGANSFRTSHYPYSEEIMQLADREGIVVIDEVPSVGMNFFDSEKKVFCKERVNKETLKNHLQVIEELIQRDKNHPCVVMWSVANEPATYERAAVPYFKKVTETVRKLDPSRPITIVGGFSPGKCRASQFSDVICVNPYYSWYSDPGHLELIEYQLECELRKWYNRFKKPVLVTEFGADTIAGFHQDPPVMFTEEYQCELLKHYHKVFDRLDFIIGEHVWCFADFVTKQGLNRVVGNKKGIFTRQRQPKAAAYVLKKRWMVL